MGFDKDKSALLFKQLNNYLENYGPYSSGGWTISVSLLDKTGEKIKSVSVDIDDAFFYRDDRYGYGLFPAFMFLEYHPGGPTCPAGPFEKAHVSLGRLRAQDLREIDSISVEVVLEKDN